MDMTTCTIYMLDYGSNESVLWGHWFHCGTLHFYSAGDIYSLCGVLHVKTSSVISVSTWRLVSYESCRYILLYATLAGLNKSGCKD